MKIERISRLLPHRREQVFDLAADVERYPEFLPGWISARILRREADVLFVEQVLGVGPLRVQFGSKALLRRPEQIDVTSAEHPFRHYSLTWRVTPLPRECCSLSVTADLEMESRLLQHVVNRILPASIRDVMAAFEARANSLYVRREG